jgi:hypothetical protein
MLRLGTVWCAGLAVLMVPEPAGLFMAALACVGAACWVTAPRSS